MNDTKKFENFLDRMQGLFDNAEKQGHIIVRLEDLKNAFPELKESEDELVRKEIISHLQHEYVVKRYVSDVEYDRWIAWLEKQGNRNYDITDEHIYWLRWVIGNLPDTEKANEAEVVLTELIQLLEKQGEQKPADKEYTFKAIPRLLEMIEPNDRAKAYCQKLIDSLTQEGYATDAKIVGECLKQMNGEKVAMATMDEQNPADKVEPKPDDDLKKLKKE